MMHRTVGRQMHPIARTTCRRSCDYYGTARPFVASTSMSTVASSLTVDPPPESVWSIPTRGDGRGTSRRLIKDTRRKKRSPNDASALIYEIQSARRVRFLKPYMTTDEIHGLAHRISILSRNGSLSSILLANEDERRRKQMEGNENAMWLPTFVADMNDEFNNYDHTIDLDHDDDEVGEMATHVLGGYDPLQLYKDGAHKDPERLKHLLASLSQLALAMWGGGSATSTNVHLQRPAVVPMITVPHGKITDGGFALCMGSYVLATRHTRFTIENLKRGLSLDPIGLSFILNRVGWDSDKPEKHNHAARYSHSIAMLMALTGWTVSSTDMVATGLATHLMNSITSLGSLERSLSELHSLDERASMIKHPPRDHGQKPLYAMDDNSFNRTIAVANLVDAVSDYSHESGGVNHLLAYAQEPVDPTITFDDDDMALEHETHLINCAATFDDILKREDSMVGVYERFVELAHMDVMLTNDDDASLIQSIAQDILKRLDAQSPLAMAATFKLLEWARRDGETLESCMKRERHLQLQLLTQTGSDFEAWAQHASKEKNLLEDHPNRKWKHASVQDVTDDEVEELFTVF